MAIRALKILAIAVASALVALMLHAGEPERLWWWALAVPFALWIIGPTVTPYILARRIGRRWFVSVMLAFLVLSSAWSAALYYEAFFVSESSTAALVMIFAPLYQWIALGSVGLLSFGVTRWLDSR